MAKTSGLGYPPLFLFIRRTPLPYNSRLNETLYARLRDSDLSRTTEQAVSFSDQRCQKIEL